MTDVRVERGCEVRPGVFAWAAPSLGLSGDSRQPLLDACDAIKSLLGDTPKHAALFRPGRSHWDIRCAIEWGSQHRVRDDNRGLGIERRKSPEEFSALRDRRAAA